MNEKVTRLAEDLRQALIESTSDITVTVNVFMSSHGCNFEINERTPESLKADYISMRNLSGLFIK